MKKTLTAKVTGVQEAPYFSQPEEKKRVAITCSVEGDCPAYPGFAFSVEQDEAGDFAYGRELTVTIEA